MKYDPENPLTKEAISRLNTNDMLVYLDSKAEYLKRFSRPLDTYHTKQFLAATKGGEITAEELKRAKEIGSIGDDAKLDNIVKATQKLGGELDLQKLGVKNHKKNRNQWFD